MRDDEQDYQPPKRPPEEAVRRGLPGWILVLGGVAVLMAAVVICLVAVGFLLVLPVIKVKGERNYQYWMAVRPHLAAHAAPAEEPQSLEESKKYLHDLADSIGKRASAIREVDAKGVDEDLVAAVESHVEAMEDAERLFNRAADRPPWLNLFGRPNFAEELDAIPGRIQQTRMAIEEQRVALQRQYYREFPPPEVLEGPPP